MNVAALFVHKGGHYFGQPAIDPWDEGRDARAYAGPHPVVAHPPCNLWVKFATVNFIRWGGSHNRPGNDGGTFAAALAAVRRWGGVLEHPAESQAWPTFGLPEPIWHRLAIIDRWRVGLRGVAVGLRTPGAQADVAVLLRDQSAARAAMGAPCRDASNRFPRSARQRTQQADNRQKGCIRYAAGISGCAHIVSVTTCKDRRIEMIWNGITWDCPHCKTVNADLREICRSCGHDSNCGEFPYYNPQPPYDSAPQKEPQ